MKTLIAGLCGLLFGVGLVLSGMTDPAKVIGFLDVAGAWDPALMFVMGGAVITYALLVRPTLRRGRPWLGVELHLPTRADIDLPLVAGAAIFGIGWGIGGFCPGPGVVAAAGGATTALVFVAAMLVGMLLWHRIDQR